MNYGDLRLNAVWMKDEVSLLALEHLLLCTTSFLVIIYLKVNLIPRQHLLTELKKVFYLQNLIITDMEKVV